MLLNKSKKCKYIDIGEKLKDYVIKNYDSQSLTERAKNFFAEISKNKNSISQVKEVKSSIEQTRTEIEIMSNYVNQLIGLMHKMSFGKDSFSCKIEFSWSDTIRGFITRSFNIYYEIYNVLFNLGVAYYYLGSATIKISQDITSHKEALTHFQKAMFFFDFLKNEAADKIVKKELPQDLAPSYLEYCRTLCESKCQNELYSITKETNEKDYKLKAKIVLGSSLLYENLIQLYPKLNGSESYINFYENRVHHYKSLMYFEIREGYQRRFKEEGIYYGHILFYTNLYVKELLECQKTVKKCSQLIDIKAFNKTVEDEGQNLKELEDTNNRIYHQALPREEEKIEPFKNNKPVLPDNIYLNENSGKLTNDDKVNCSDLDLLIPKEAKAMLDNYKQKMNELAKTNIDRYENDETIKDFVQNLFLPKKLSVRREEYDENESPIEIPSQILKKLESIRAAGGVNKLRSIMEGIMTNSNGLLDKLTNLVRSFEAEDIDDEKCRNKYIDKWLRPPSKKLNGNFINSIHNYIKTIQNTKYYDQQEYNDLMCNLAFFQELSKSNIEIINKIPIDEKLISELPIEKQIREEIFKLYDLGDDCMKIIKPIYNEINADETIVIEFIKVLAKKTTEQHIFESRKNKYEEKFKNLENLTNQIRNQEEKINKLVSENREKMESRENPNKSREAIDYFQTLEKYADLFLIKMEKVKKGENFYRDLTQKITDLGNAANEWMIRRNEEKMAILSTIDGVKMQVKSDNFRLNQSDMLDPSLNPFTKMKSGTKFYNPTNVGNINNNQNMYNNNNQQGQGYNQNPFGYNQNQGGYNPNQGGFNPNQGGFNPNQRGFNPNQGGYNPNSNFNNNFNLNQSEFPQGNNQNPFYGNQSRFPGM